MSNRTITVTLTRSLFGFVWSRRVIEVAVPALPFADLIR